MEYGCRIRSFPAIPPIEVRASFAKISASRKLLDQLSMLRIELDQLRTAPQFEIREIETRRNRTTGERE